MTTTPSPFTIHAGALLASTPASTTATAFNEALAAYGLCLPIVPLRAEVTLAELVACNSGGRYRLQSGPIGRYVRAATLERDGKLLTIGGPTLKRATGYNLHRALAGQGVRLGTIRELTFNLRPLPAATALRLVRGPIERLLALADHLVVDGVGVRALAFDVAGMLLIELAGLPAVVERQSDAVARAATRAQLTLVTDSLNSWYHWEELAHRHTALPADQRLDVTLPRRALPDLIAACRALTGITIWGDAGVGSVHIGPLIDRTHYATVKAHVAALGGQPCTEFGPPPEPTFPSLVPATGVTEADPVRAMQQVVGKRFLIHHPDQLAVYGQDASIAQPNGLPLAVALPATTDEVAALMRIAAAHRLPVVTRGAGSGLAGGSVPTAGSLVIGLNRMEQLAIDREQQVAHVGAGVITAELQRAAERVGLFYPPDPSSQTASTIGGNIACNAGGPRCLKYGVTADYVLGVTAVLADGTIVRYGDGFSGQGESNGLAQLLVGSEGTLAVITEATLRLIPLPRARRTTMAIFRTLHEACATVERIMASGLIPASLELMDDTTIAAVEAYLQIGLPRDAGALLLMLADGEPEAVDQEATALAELARTGGAERVVVARTAGDEANLWQARRVIAPALARIRPNRLGEDISVPVPQIAACVSRIKQVSAAYELPIVVFGHAGDGNLHPNILFDARNPGELARLWPCAEAIFAVALEMGGTLSGEHGIGTLKRPFVRQALGETQIAIQRAIKSHFDPEGRLNPGKVLP
ncbi:MAG: lactate dehydrogenase [Chloroflexus sp.]|uniref:FAD-binding oxidoreductase n=1 Tax=Chloroflexus sp. TaxID=1904827 RepID=UPI0021DC84B1|nr:FAD-linked oxidase C-terminal domain-containing protein [Chloroflexus sp.]GIV88017.1 MAG: lactate dehydrogenase [Chloroflexus sp.]